MVRLTNLTRKYGDTVAVRDVSVEIARGEIVGLLGHNGAGKTTVMKMLTGFVEPTSGTASIDGLDVVDQRTLAQEKLGYLPENAPMYAEMLVHEYLRMMADLRGVSRDEQDAAVWNAARQTGLSEHLEHPIDALSKGFRQRVGIAQAIVHDPDVLVLDEPTNGLDPLQIQSIRDLITGLGKRTTVILSTHILQEVEAVCERVLVMIDGTLAADERLSDLLRSDTVRLVVSGIDGAATSLLGAVEGVVSVAMKGVSDHAVFSMTTEAGQDPIPAIVSLAAVQGWNVHEVAPVTRTLEDVFKELQAAHIARAKGAV